MKLLKGGIFKYKEVFDYFTETETHIIKAYRYQKDRCGEFVAYKDEENRVYIGYSICHVKDIKHYNKETGVALALERADKAWTEELKCPNFIIYDLYCFIQRCKQYYKDGEFPNWALYFN